jgi:hypothetical protein
MGAAFFYGPNPVGVLFPDYFEGMPLTIVAFILAMVSTFWVPFAVPYLNITTDPILPGGMA